MSRLLLLVLAVVLTSCRSEHTVPIPAVPPFSEIGAIELGMTAEEVRAARPVEFAPYAGLGEPWEEGKLVYHIAGTLTDHAEPDKSDRLTAVSYEHVMPGGDEAAAAEYDRFMQQWTSVLGVPACRSNAPHVAVWRSGELELTARRNVSTPSGTDAGVYLKISRDSTNLEECGRPTADE